MFRRKDNLIVTQAEHSRLSGELAALIGAAVGFEDQRLFGAIALHDWPHFADPQFADTIEIGAKTDEQQLELLGRLHGEMPLNAFTELIVRLHWRRLSDAQDVDMQEAIDSVRIERLIATSALTPLAAKRLDGWTDFCDSLSFYLSRGEPAQGSVLLEAPGHAAGWQLGWETCGDALLITGVPKPCAGKVSLLAFDATDYPDVLAPVLREIPCTFAA